MYSTIGGVKNHYSDIYFSFVFFFYFAFSNLVLNFSCGSEFVNMYIFYGYPDKVLWEILVLNNIYVSHNYFSFYRIKDLFLLFYFSSYI